MSIEFNEVFYESFEELFDEVMTHEMYERYDGEYIREDLKAIRRAMGRVVDVLANQKAIDYKQALEILTGHEFHDAP